jgi:hypothetical protein
MGISFVGKMAVILAASGLTIGAVAGSTQAAGSPGWRVAATIAPHSEEVQLNAVTAIAPRNAWAVGPTGTSTGNLVEHWNGTSWQQVAVPAAVLAKIGDPLNYVSATSTSNVWAFNFNGNWLRFNGSTWTTGRVPTFPGGQTGLEIATGLAAGAQDAWLFGLDSTSSKLISYAARFNGRAWQAISLPGPVNSSDTYDASAVSANNIWAIAGGGPGTGTANGLLHWDGIRWHMVTLPSFLASKTNLASVLALPGGDVWVAGGIPGSSGSAQGVTALWNGHTWTVDKLPADPAAPDDVISDLVSDGSGGAWAMGFTASSCAGPMWHYRSGNWTDTGPVGCSVGAYVHGPQGLANVPGTTSVWAVGGQNDPHVPNDEAGLVMLYGPTP